MHLIGVKYICCKKCECAGIGRQARLRGVCCKTYGFKSHHSHQLNMISHRKSGGLFLYIVNMGLEP